MTYSTIIVETYHEKKASKSSLIHVRPIVGQTYDTSLDVECSRKMRKDYPIGTKFRIRVKLTNREGGKAFLYSNYNWPYEVLD